MQKQNKCDNNIISKGQKTTTKLKNTVIKLKKKRNKIKKQFPYFLFLCFLHFNRQTQKTYPNHLLTRPHTNNTPLPLHTNTTDRSRNLPRSLPAPRIPERYMHAVEQPRHQRRRREPQHRVLQLVPEVWHLGRALADAAGAGRGELGGRRHEARGAALSRHLGGHEERVLHLEVHAGRTVLLVQSAGETVDEGLAGAVDAEVAAGGEGEAGGDVDDLGFERGV